MNFSYARAASRSRGGATSCYAVVSKIRANEEVNPVSTPLNVYQCKRLSVRRTNLGLTAALHVWDTVQMCLNWHEAVRHAGQNVKLSCIVQLPKHLNIP